MHCIIPTINSAVSTKRCSHIAKCGLCSPHIENVKQVAKNDY